jgi:hypothetical protein
MDLKQFWNKAIEFYCISNKQVGDYVFVSINEENIEKIYNEYLKYLEKNDFTLIENQINTKIIDSYYLAIKDIHEDLDSPKKYPYLRFSIFTIFRFSENNNILSGYWANFENFLISKKINTISTQIRTNYLQNIKDSLEKNCIKKDLKFYNINIYGSLARRINVGLIYAHALFSSEEIIKIKKAIYECGLAYENSLKYLTDNQISDILSRSYIQRIIKLFNLDNPSKDLIKECLQIWLKNWEPAEEEEIKLTNSNKTRFNVSNINLNWIWIIEAININDKIIKRKAGFILRNSLGNDGVINVGKDSKVNLGKSYMINEQEYLYFLDDYNGTDTLLSVDLNKRFNPPPIYEPKYPVVIRKISSFNYEPMYFFQETRQNITFWKEKLFLCLNIIIKELAVKPIKFNISELNEIIYLHHINDNFSYQNINFFKSDNSINLELTGVTGGVPGKKTFLNLFPVQVHFYNLNNGLFEIYKNNNNNKVVEFEIFEKINNFSDTIELPILEQGEYYIKLLKDGLYCMFQNKKTELYFEILQDGNQDNRKEILISKNIYEYSDITFKNHEFEENWFITENHGKLENGILDHRLFDFCFQIQPDPRGWYISMARDKFFIYFLNNELNNQFISEKRNRLNSIYNLEFTDCGNIFCYKIKFIYDCKYTVKINPILYISKLFTRDKEIRLNCICLELLDFDEDLLVKYPNLKVGKKIYFITNYNFLNQLDKLINIFSQKEFPFFKDINHA